MHICMSACLTHVVCPLAHVGLLFCLTVYLLPPICLSVCLPVCALSVCLPACPSVPTLTFHVPADLLVGLSATLLVKLSLM